MIQITSIHNSYIKELHQLQDKKERDRLQLFLVEGYHLVQEAKKAKVLKTVLILDEKDQIDGVENIITTKEVIKKLSFVSSPQPIIGVCFFLKSTPGSLEKYLILDNIQDPGNVGTLIRSAVGFGIKDIIFSESMVDLYNDKLIRSTQGALFHVNIYKTNLLDFILMMKEKNIFVIGTALEGAKDISTLRKRDQYAIVLGNEANGVSKEILEVCDCKVKIGISSEIESLNVSVAGGILMYHLGKND